MECSGNKIWYFLACALLLTQGCLASTNMASVTNPMWEPRFIGSMLIWVESADLNVRREMEDEFEALAGKHQKVRLWWFDEIEGRGSAPWTCLQALQGCLE